MQDDFQDTKVEGKFDYVYSSHVIEHCSGPLKFMESAYKVLKTGGIAFIYLPLEDRTVDNDHYGRMRHRSFWKDIDTFRDKVVEKSKFKEVSLSVVRIENGHVEALFVGVKQ